MQQAEIDQIFAEFDENKNGTLDTGELEAFLRKLRPDSDVTDADTQYVLQKCDADGDGTISREEVLPVCAVWQTLVDEHARRGSSCMAELRHCCWCFFGGCLLCGWCCGGKKPDSIAV